MKKRGMALLCAALLALSSCALLAGEEEQPPEGAYALYFSVVGGEEGGGKEAAVDFEYRVPAEDMEAAPALVEALLAGPEDPRLVSPFPAGTHLRSWRMEESGGIRLDMNESYGALSGIDLTIANYCLTLTLCQLEDVDYVHVTVMGEELPFWRADALREGDVILSGAEEQPVTVTATLYYPRTAGEGLGVEYRDVVVTEGDILAGAVMAAWAAGPTYQSLRGPLPEGTALLSVSVDGGVCYVNFSAALLNAEEGTARELVYSIVNTASSLEKVEAVQLQVEGENLAHLAGVPTTALTADYTLEG